MQTYLDFEKPIAELEGQIESLRRHTKTADKGETDEAIQKLKKRIQTRISRIYKSLDAWQKTQVARHPARPHTMDYIDALVDDFTILAGDRLYADDKAIIAGLGFWGEQRIAILGHEKGATTQDRVYRNFGMARPEGYRKAIRIMGLADRFGIPVVSLIDTAGAYPGIGAEERGQSEAIARCTDKCLMLRVPLISVVIGEGGSGGALALATANRILMLEHAIYTVASPEACASILWRTSDNADQAAAALQVTAQSLERFSVIDRILPEPMGGAHRGRDQIMADVGTAVTEELAMLSKMSADELRTARRQKFLKMGREGLT